MRYAHIAARVIGVPLAVHELRLKVVLAAVGDRLGLAAEADPVAVDAAQAQAERQRSRSYQVSDQGIAVVPVAGTLVSRKTEMDAMSGDFTSYGELEASIWEAATDPGVRGILLAIDSPGGEVKGMNALVDFVREVAAETPTWAFAEDAFSAAYAIAAATSRIVVPRTGGVGSVGTIAVHVDCSQEEAARGRVYTIVRDGQFKAEFTELEPLSEHAAQTLQEVVSTFGGMFRAQVAADRGLEEQAVQDMQAQVYYGDQGIQVGLADQIGSITQAHDALVAHISNPQEEDTQMAKSLTPGHQAAAAAPTPAPPTPPDPPAEPAAAEAQADPAAERSTTLLEFTGAEDAIDYANQVADLCALAGCPARAAGFLRDRTPLATLRQVLLTERAQTDEADRILSAHEATPTGGAVVDMAAVHRDVYARYEKAQEESRGRFKRMAG